MGVVAAVCAILASFKSQTVCFQAENTSFRIKMINGKCKWIIRDLTGTKAKFFLHVAVWRFLVFTVGFWRQKAREPVAVSRTTTMEGMNSGPRYNAGNGDHVPWRTVSRSVFMARKQQNEAFCSKKISKRGRFGEKNGFFNKQNWCDNWKEFFK